jgi:signal transduction histidine kinase
MRLTSFRARVFGLSVLLAVAVVATVLITSYLVMASAMQDVAQREAARLSRTAWGMVHGRVSRTLLEARAEGLTGPELKRIATERFARSLPAEFGTSGTLLEGAFAFYRQDSLDSPAYASEPAARAPSAAARARAIANGQPVAEQIGPSGLAATLFAPHPNIGTYVVHSPFQDPLGAWWVLDTVYEPTREIDAIDHVRTPLIVISVLAVFATVLLMQLTLGWVLRLVNDLRTAAESVDSGELDMRLPDSGEHEIADLARSLNSVIDRLRRRADAQTRFVADASHELATPVAGIRGYVNILKGWGADDPAVRAEAIGAIDRESRRMARLTTQLLELIRSEEVLDLHSVRHDVNAVARSVVSQTASRYADKKLEFTGPDPGPLVLFGDPDRIEDVLSILVDNAAKYTPSGGRVSVQTYRRKGDVVIEVSDTGPGIPAEDLPNIFDRFYRSDASRSAETGGFGLGLAIAKRIVDSSGGLIDVRSQVGKGTTFTIRLPRGRD